GEKLAACIRELGPAGGICDASALSGQQRVRDDPFAGSDGMVRVLLGEVIIETSETWKLPDKTELAGRGAGTTLRMAAADKGVITNSSPESGNSNISVHDLTLDGNSATNPGSMSTIAFRHVSDFTIEHVSVLHSANDAMILEDGCIRGKVANNHIE